MCTVHVRVHDGMSVAGDLAHPAGCAFVSAGGTPSAWMMCSRCPGTGRLPPLWPRAASITLTCTGERPKEGGAAGRRKAGG
jgi:hypothetical protein